MPEDKKGKHFFFFKFLSLPHSILCQTLVSTCRIYNHQPPIHHSWILLAQSVNTQCKTTLFQYKFNFSLDFSYFVSVCSICAKCALCEQSCIHLVRVNIFNFGIPIETSVYLYKRNCHLKYWHDFCAGNWLICLSGWWQVFFSLSSQNNILFCPVLPRSGDALKREIHVFQILKWPVPKVWSNTRLWLINTGRRLELSLKTLRYFIPAACEKYPPPQ